jgi:hypothetical protein
MPQISFKSDGLHLFWLQQEILQDAEERISLWLLKVDTSSRAALYERSLLSIENLGPGFEALMELDLTRW